MALLRALRVTVGLIIACAIVGGVCGLFALLPSVLHPTSDDMPLKDAAPLVFGYGAVLAALLGPPIALSALRHIPLWRVLLEPAIGTVIGVLIALPLSWTPATDALPWLLVLPPLGMAIAAIRLRLAVRRREHNV
jgi:hypothetical protein